MDIKPTQKQIDFAQAIAEELAIDPPFGGDRSDYSEFIDEYVDEFYRNKNARRYSEDRIFELDHAYHLLDFVYDRISKNPKSVR